MFRHDRLIINREGIGRERTESELGRLDSAFSFVVKEVTAARERSEKESERELYGVELLMLMDPEYRKNIEFLIRERLFNAEHAVEDASEAVISVLSSLNDEYMRERRNDIRDIEMSLLAALSGKMRGRIVLSSPVVLIADYLLTSEILNIEGAENLLAIATDRGGRTSHVAIIARNKGIPGVTGLRDLSEKVREGEYTCVDGTEGKVYLSPDSDTVEAFLRKEPRHALIHSQKETYTLDRKRIVIRANVDSVSDIPETVRMGCEGIGLFRTEFIPQLGGDLNSPEIYRAALLNASGPVTFRTRDDGGDKSEEWKNDLLGLRSIRKSLTEKDVFKKQIEAILSASSETGARLLIPFITGVGELDEVLSVIDEVKDDMRLRGKPFDEHIETGCMIEVPSCALMSSQIADRVDFLSIGTNDLTQYTLATGRDDETVSGYYQDLDPAVLKLIAMTVENAHRKGKKVCVCGQAAGDPMAIPVLIGLGADELSMSASAAPDARAAVRSVTYEECLELSEKVLGLSDAEAVRNAVSEFRKGLGDE